MLTDLKDFQPLFGEAKAELEAATPHALLPFLYFIQALDGTSLRLQITDFHSNTWESVKTADQLEQLRDEVGIGGSWHDFLSYLGAAFSSDNVRLILGGPASSVGGYGATSAKVTAQKSKGMPRVSIYLEKLADPLASDVMGNISVELFRNFKQKSDALVMAEGRLSQMSVIMASEKIDATDSLDELKAMFLNIVNDDYPKPDIGKKRLNNCLREKATTSHWNSMPYSTCEFKNQDQLRGGFHYEATALGNENSSAFGGGYGLESQELKQMFMSMVDPEFYELAYNKETSDKPSSQKDGKKQCKSGPTTFDELVAETLFPEGGITGPDLFGMGLWSQTGGAVCSEASITSSPLAEENGDSKRRKLCQEQKGANRTSEELGCTYRWSADFSGGSFSNNEDSEPSCFF